MRQRLKQVFRNACRKRGWDFVKGPNLSQFIESRDVDLVIDVGGNKGDYGYHVRRWGYRGQILSLEPASEPYGLLVKRLERDPAWQARKVAAGEQPGEATINLSKSSVFNSLLPLTDFASRFDPNSEVLATETVQVDTLDNILAPLAFQRGFLKIDTQGFEKQVLAGAGETLKRCVGVQLELPIGHLYGGVWSFGEALEHLDGLGFVLAQNVPTNSFSHDKAAVIEFDCVFRRKDERDV